tara:strand:- start:101 stop:628 length:528 start_codon:yes stop_codon:yes gene_type:complete
MAYTDVQNKVSQIRMANRVLLAQAMSDEDKFKKKKELKKQVRKTPKQRQSEARGKDPKFQGGSPGTVFVPPDGPITDQDIQDALQDEDMRQGDYLEDPENPLSDLMKIGGAAAGGLLRLLINPMDLQMSKLPHTPPTEKIVLPNGKLMDSPLRFKTDQERIKFMEDFSRGYGRYS